MDNQVLRGNSDQPVLQDVLFIGPDQADFDAIKHCLSGGELTPIRVHWKKTFTTALASIRTTRFQVIILDLFLRDSKGLQTLEALQGEVPHTPILVITNPEDEQKGKLAVKLGASDFLIKGSLEVRPLLRSLENLIDRKSEEQALHTERERAVVTLNSIGDAVLCTDNFGIVTYLNPVAEKMTGWSLKDAIGRSSTDVIRIIDATTREPISDPMQFTIRHDKPVTLMTNSLLIRKDGFESPIEDSVAPIHDRAGQVTGAVIVFHDIGEARAMALKMSHLAQYDFLTDLPNRVLFNDRLTQAVSMARRHQRKLAVLFLDCDNFKEVNDSLGHHVGDLLLQSVAKRLQLAVRASDTVSRHGGDEFIILLSELTSPADGDLCASKIIQALTLPHQVGQHNLKMMASIGIAIYPDDARNAETLIKCADKALYEAKKSGGANYQSFQRPMNMPAIERSSMEVDLLRALEREEFYLHYQPRVSMASGVIVGAEALIRWKHPARGLIHPAAFVPVAEDSGLIVPIGRWVLREACRQVEKWRVAGLGIVPMAVNVSAVEFHAIGFLEGITHILADHALNAGQLELELTESVLMQDKEASHELLQALTNLGMKLTLDDFGTGFSSLSYLRHFPISTLKIDRSFLLNLCSSADDRAMVAAIIGIGKSLRQKVIAEGIETEEQCEVLRELNCDEGQGFYFCRPLPADDLSTYLEATRGRRISNQGAESRQPPRRVAVGM